MIFPSVAPHPRWHRFALAEILLLIALIIMVALGPGCRTTGPGPETPGLALARVTAISRLAAWSGCTAATLSDPDSRGTWTRTRDAIVALEATERWDAASLSVILREHGINELVGTEGSLSITAGILLLDSFTGRTWDLASEPYVRAVIVGVRSGLDLALGQGTKAGRIVTRERLTSAAEATR